VNETRHFKQELPVEKQLSVDYSMVMRHSVSEAAKSICYWSQSTDVSIA
jgi:hypothetical protein